MKSKAKGKFGSDADKKMDKKDARIGKAAQSKDAKIAKAKLPAKNAKGETQGFGPNKGGPTSQKDGQKPFMGADANAGSKATVEQATGGASMTGAHNRGGLEFDNTMRGYHHDSVEHDSSDR